MGSVGPDSLINQIRCGNRFNKDNPCPKSMCLAQFPGWCRGCGEPIDVNDILVDSDFREDPVFGVYNATIPAPFSLTDPPRAEAKKYGVIWIALKRLCFNKCTSAFAVRSSSNILRKDNRLN